MIGIMLAIMMAVMTPQTTTPMNVVAIATDCEYNVFAIEVNNNGSIEILSYDGDNFDITDGAVVVPSVVISTTEEVVTVKMYDGNIYEFRGGCYHIGDNVMCVVKGNAIIGVAE